MLELVSNVVTLSLLVFVTFILIPSQVEALHH